MKLSIHNKTHLGPFVFFILLYIIQLDISALAQLSNQYELDKPYIITKQIDVRQSIPGHLEKAHNAIAVGKLFQAIDAINGSENEILKSNITKNIINNSLSSGYHYSNDTVIAFSRFGGFVGTYDEIIMYDSLKGLLIHSSNPSSPNPTYDIIYLSDPQLEELNYLVSNGGFFELKQADIQNEGCCDKVENTLSIMTNTTFNSIWWETDIQPEQTNKLDGLITSILDLAYSNSTR